MKNFSDPPLSSVLKHVAIIPDGNNRWAKKQDVTPIEAYSVGAKRLLEIVQRTCQTEIPFLTIYVMSLENLQKRSALWRKTFFSFVTKTIRLYKKDPLLKKVRLKLIGRLEYLPQKLREELEDLVQSTQPNKGTTVVLAVAYTGQDEIFRAAVQFARFIQENKSETEDLTVCDFEKYFDTSGIPPVDLLIRTSGEQRLSGFLLWQIAYAEFVFDSKLWPDFLVDDFDHALTEFKKRQRNFGKERKP